MLVLMQGLMLVLMLVLVLARGELVGPLLCMLTRESS